MANFIKVGKDKLIVTSFYVLREEKDLSTLFTKMTVRKQIVVA